MRRIATILVVVAILAWAGARRSSGLLDLTPWSDEAFELVQVYGIDAERPWPAAFRHADVVSEAGLIPALKRAASEGVYPPLAYLVLSLARLLGEPLLWGRIGGMASFLLALLLGILYLLRTHGKLAAVLFALLASLSSLLVLSAQEVKHTAFTPLLGLCSALVFERLIVDTRRTRWLGFGYVLVTGLGMLAHVTFFHLVVGQGVCAASSRGAWRKHWLKLLALSTLICVPWYAYAGARQLGVALSWFRSDALQGPSSFAHPADAVTTLRDLFYVSQSLSGLGLGASGGMRWFLPLFLATWLPLLAGRQLWPGRWAVGTTLLGGLASWLVVHATVAFACGHSGALQPHYLAPLSLVFFLVWAVSLSRLNGMVRAATITVALTSLLLGGLVAGTEHRGARQLEGLTIDRELGRYLRDQVQDTDELRFLHTMHAKLVNVVYHGNALQRIGAGLGESCPQSGRVYYITSTTVPRPELTSAWPLLERRRFGRTEIFVMSAARCAGRTGS